MRFLKQITLAFFICNSLLAQTSSKDFFSAWYSADNNNLPQNSVKSITKDKSGFIWISTENGLVRFDGQRFNNFNSENVSEIKSNRMQTFYGNPNLDTIYIKNDRDQYLTIINRDVSVVAENKIPSKYRSSSYTVFDKTVSSFEYQKIFLKNDNFYKITPDSVNFINGKNKFLYQNSILANTTKFFFSINGSVFIFEDNKNFFRVAFNGKIFKAFFNINLKIDQIYKNDLAHQAFIKSGKDLYLLEFKNNKLLPHLVYSGLNDKENIASLYYDNATKILYLGSTSKGLLVIKRNAFQTIIGDKSNGVYYAQIPFNENNSLATTGEIFTNDGTSEKLNLETINDNYILLRDKNGNIWSKNDNVLIQYTKESKFKKTKKWHFKYRITEIFEDKSGKIFIATSIKKQSKGEIFSLNGNTFLFEFMVDFSTTFMVQGVDDKIWVGSQKGLHSINFQTKKIENIGPISETYVRNIYTTNKDEIWFSTYNTGIYLYRPSTKIITHFPADNNKFLLTAHCIIEDKKGFFWITTNKGLFQVSKKNLLDYEAQKTKSVYYHYYDKTNGFNTNEFNGGCHPCGLILNNGEITFPSMEGIVYFDPLKITPILPKNDIYFDDVEVDGKKVNLTNETLVLNYDFERLIFSVNSPYYGNKENLNIEIKLEGPQSQNWIDVKDENVSFSSLPPGEYTLTARKSEGFNSEFKYSSIKISITPPFWKTFWFNLIFIILSGVIVYYIIKFRVKYIRKKNRILELQIAEKTSQLRNTIKSLKKTEQRLSLEIINHKKLLGQITHDIKSPLRFLALTGKYVYQNQDKPEKIKDEIKSIYTSSFQLYNFVDHILEYAKTNEKETITTFDIRDLINEKIMLFQNLASSQGTEIWNFADKKETITCNRLILSIIIHNLLDNAVKNTISGKISFTTGEIEGKNFVSIKDSGKGMSEEKVNFYNKITQENPSENQGKRGMGLKNIRELLLIMRGQMHIESNKNAGTKITVIIPIIKKN